MERVRVGDVLRLERRPVEIDPVAQYTLIGVYSFGKGIFHRDPITGSELGDYRFFSIEPGDLVLSNIQAWEGAIACAEGRDAGTVGTHRFLTYVPIDERVDTSWARWFFLSERGFELIQRAAPGTVMRNRTLSIDRFEALEIPLPSIDEQRRMARQLDADRVAAQRISEHIAGRPDILALLPTLLDGMLTRYEAEERMVGTLAEFVSETVHATEAVFSGLPFVGLEHIEPHTGQVVGESSPADASGPKKVFAKGDVLYPRLRPYQNKVWLADRPGVCSSDQIVLRPHDSQDGALLAVLLRCRHALDQAIAMTSSLQLPRIRQAEFASLRLRVPSDGESFLTLAHEVTARVRATARASAHQRELAHAYLPAALNEAFSALT